MATQHWNIDPSHSSVGFTVRHMVISKVRGSFARFSGALDFDEQNPAASKVTVNIDAASINTHEEKRDGHLRSPDFLDVAQHPALTFESTAVAAKGEGLTVTGNLSLRGITKVVVLDAQYLGGGKDPWGNQRIGFSAHGKINRKEFGLGWNQVLEAGGVLVGESVELAFDVQAVKA